MDQIRTSKGRPKSPTFKKPLHFGLQIFAIQGARWIPKMKGGMIMPRFSVTEESLAFLEVLERRGQDLLIHLKEWLDDIRGAPMSPGERAPFATLRAGMLAALKPPLS